MVRRAGRNALRRLYPARIQIGGVRAARTPVRQAASHRGLHIALCEGAALATRHLASATTTKPERFLRKSLAVISNRIDPNFVCGEYLIDQMG